MALRWLLGALALCLSVSLVMAKQGVVKTKDGRTIEGDITDKGEEGVVIKAKAGLVSMPRADVASILYAGSIEELYRQRLAALPANADGAAHLELARWLYENRAYELARKEAEAALAAEPNDAQAVVLKQTIDRAILWEKAKASPAQRATDKADASAKTDIAIARNGAAAQPAGAKEKQVLTLDEVNLIKQRELTGSEQVLRVRFDSDVKRRFIASTDGRMKMDELLKMPEAEQAMLILREGPAELAKGVKILVDPAPVAEFKLRIQPMILSGCASAACHGGVHSGTFSLRYPASSEAATYTNYYILKKYSTDVEGATVKAIDRTLPNKSLLVQYGLSRDKAEMPHPQVKGFVPVFRSEQDAKLQLLIDWMSRNLQRPADAEYAVDFPVHTGTASARQLAGGETAEGEQNGMDWGDGRDRQMPPSERARPRQRPGNRSPEEGEGGNGDQEQPDDRLKEAKDRIRPGAPIQLPPVILPF